MLLFLNKLTTSLEYKTSLFTNQNLFYAIYYIEIVSNKIFLLNLKRDKTIFAIK